MDDFAAFTPAQGREIWDAVRRKPASSSSPVFRGIGAFEKPFRYKFVDGVLVFPPFGIGEVTDVETEGEWTVVVRRPTGDDKALYIVNSNMEVTSGSSDPYGFGYWGMANPVHAIYDDAATPANSKEWGPQPSSFKLQRGRAGFITVSDGTGSSTDRVLVCQRGKQGIYFGTNSGSNVSKNGNATVTMKDASGTTFGFTRSVKCRLAGLEANRDCHISLIDGTWELVGKECEV